MYRSATSSGSGGRPWGGPRSFCVLVALPLLTAAVSACGGRAAPDRPQPVRGSAFTNPLEIYRDLGFMTGPAQFPVVASFTTLAGPADSTWVMLALSIPNRALRFQREGTGFYAEYMVTVDFMDRDSVVVKRGRSRELVRVASFNETGRSDESVVHQQLFALPAGSYLVRLDAADAHSSRGFRMLDSLSVPSYGAAAVTTSPPVLVHEGRGREERAAMPSLITNPRRTVPYGGTAPRLYVESYDGSPTVVTVRADGGTSVWSGAVEWTRTNDLSHAFIDIPPDALPLGRFEVDVASEGAVVSSAPLVMTISDQWMVANFDDVIQFMRFIATAAELDSLRAGSPPDRRASWDRFWDERDPLPITAVNEFREEFFERVRYATEAFRETAGRAGWDTDRGEVYIVLGAPDRAQEAVIGTPDVTNQPNAEEWVYHNVGGYRLSLLFHDRTGFGRYELVPSSAAAFRSAAERLKRARTESSRGR